MDTQVQQPTITTDEEPMLGLTEKAAEKVREIQAAEAIEAFVKQHGGETGTGAAGMAGDCTGADLRAVLAGR